MVQHLITYPNNKSKAEEKETVRNFRNYFLAVQITFLEIENFSNMIQ